MPATVRIGQLSSIAIGSQTSFATCLRFIFASGSGYGLRGPSILARQENSASENMARLGETTAMRKLLPGLLSFNGGFVDTAGFIGLQGLFTAHVTGNFVTLGASLVF